MREIFRTSDPVEISFLKSVFQEADIPVVLFDEFTSQMLSGILGDEIPCRIMVLDDDDYEDAVTIINDVLELDEDDE